MKRAALPVLILLLSGCGKPKSKSPDLPEQPDRWVMSVSLQDDSKMKHVGKTSAILGATEVKSVNGIRSIRIGDDIDGVQIGAIKCSFFSKDASYSGQQFMWRGRWGCQAGRSQDEVSNAVKDDGTKLYDYIHVAPVSLDTP